MSDDLIKRVCQSWVDSGWGDESFWEHWPECPTDDTLSAKQVLDRIEELERERDEARHLQSCACNYDTPTDVCMGHHALFERLYAVERGKLEDVITALTEQLEAARHDADEAEAYAWQLEQRLAKAVEALRECQEALRDHIKQYPHMAKGYTVDAEKNARAVLAELEKTK